MPMMLFPKCWRGREDCMPFQAIDGADENLSEEQLMTLDYEPKSFVCCGCIEDQDRKVPQDAYRVCWKNSEVDEMGDYDEQDLTHLLACVTMALAVIGSRRVNSGRVQVPSNNGSFTEVETMQAPPSVEVTPASLEGRS